MEAKRVLNPRTNRYVTVGSSAYRRFAREQELPPKVQKGTKRKEPEPQEQEDEELEQAREELNKPAPKKKKLDKGVVKEVVKKSLRVVNQHQEKFDNAVDDQVEYNRLIKKYLTRELKKKKKKDDSSSDESD